MQPALSHGASRGKAILYATKHFQKAQAEGRPVLHSPHTQMVGIEGRTDRDGSMQLKLLSYAKTVTQC